MRRHLCTSPPIEPPFKALQVIISADEEADVWIVLDARIVAYYQAGPNRNVLTTAVLGVV